MKSKKSLCILDENAKWWKGSPDIKQWAIEDKNGDWWLVGGSEFAERKIKKKNKEEKKIKETSGTLMQVTIIVLTCILGISLALNLLLILDFFN